MENEEATLISAPCDDPEQVITIPFDLYQSFLGRYYIGRTPTLTLRPGCNCWGGLANPDDSPVNLFVDSISVACLSPVCCCARIWLSNTLFGQIFVSPFVTLANTAMDPMPVSNALLSYAQNLSIAPFNGDSLTAEIIRPLGTLTNSFGGKVIIPPGGSVIVYLSLLDSGGCLNCEVSCRWWEKETD